MTTNARFTPTLRPTQAHVALEASVSHLGRPWWLSGSGARPPAEFSSVKQLLWPTFSTSASAASLTPVRSCGHAPPRVSERGARAHAGAPWRPATPSGRAWNYIIATFLSRSVFLLVLERVLRLANKNSEKDEISLQLVIRKKCDLFPSYHPCRRMYGTLKENSCNIRTNIYLYKCISATGHK